MALHTNVVNKLTHYEWMLILTKQDNRCIKCNRKFEGGLVAERDHIIPLYFGGGLIEDNVQALCRSCNAQKGRNFDFKKGTVNQMHLSI